MDDKINLFLMIFMPITFFLAIYSIWKQDWLIYGVTYIFMFTTMLGVAYYVDKKNDEKEEILAKKKFEKELGFSEDELL